MATDMLAKLPKRYDPYEVRNCLEKMGLLNSMVIFLRQEIDRMQKVNSTSSLNTFHFVKCPSFTIQILIRIYDSLNDLLLAIEGTIIMNEQLRDAFDNIFDARLPNAWKRGSWDSSTLGFWFSELLERDVQYKTWLTEVICICIRIHRLKLTSLSRCRDSR